MKPSTLTFKRLLLNAVLPTRAHPGDAGLDLYACNSVVIFPKQGAAIRTGIAVAIPDGYTGLVCDRSSLGKQGLKTMGGVIDAGYRGEIHVVMFNVSNVGVRIKRGDRVAQLLILPIATPEVKEVVELGNTPRGENGFGSSGK